MSEDQTWVSVAAVAWVLDRAPVPTELALTLVAIARRADANGRGARPSVATVAKATGKSPDQTQRDIGKLRALGLLVLGDQSLVAHLPARNRPVVYDMPLTLVGDKPARASRNPTGKEGGTRYGIHAVSESADRSGMDAGSSTGMDAVSRSGMDAVQKKTLKKTSEKD
jgi:hypothetical protein